jgi:outer membrane protein assembly factor BamB
MSTLLLISLVIGFLQEPSHEAGWTQFRGEHRNGTVHGLPRETLGPQLQWEFPLPSEGIGGIAASDELVVVSSRDANNNRDVFLILDPDTGALIAKHDIDSTGSLDYGNSPRATPVIGPELVYLLGAFGNLVAFDPLDGSVRWESHLVQRLGGKMPTWGYCASPLLVDNLLVVMPGGPDCAIAGLDSSTGQVLWKSPGTTGASYACPTVLDLGADQRGHKQIVGCDETGMVSWSINDGREIWRIRPKIRGEFMVPSPLVVQRSVYWLGESNGLRKYQVAELATKETPPDLVAELPEIVNDTHSPVCCGGLLLVISDGLRLIDPSQDLNELDSLTHKSLDNYAAIMTASDRALVCCSDGSLLLLSIEHGKLQIVDRAEPHRNTAPVLAQPAFHNGLLMMRLSHSIRCYRLSK